MSDHIKNLTINIEQEQEQNIQLAQKPENTCISFQSDSCNKTNWVMKLAKINGVNRVLFNREAFPDSKENDFANAVIEILERAYPNIGI